MDRPPCRLEQLPCEIGELIWGKLTHVQDGNSVMATSHSIQALFGPAVQSLALTLQADRKPDLHYFRGLHHSIQPQRATITTPGFDENSVEPGACDTSDTHVQLPRLLAQSTPHFNRLWHLILQGFRLPPGLSDQTPPSIFVNLTVLQLENITVQGSELGATLSRCPQLTQLELLAAIIQGSTLPLSVLNKLASLALSLCDVEQQDLPWGEPRLAFLGQLGSSLTSLSVIAEDAPMTVSSRVLACATNDLHRLTDLVVSSIPYAPHPSTIARLAQGPAAEHLEELVLSLNLPDMECLAHLIAMPKLGRLGGQLSLSGRPATVPPKPKVCWPQGKPPMQLHLDSAGVRLLTALPFECFSCVNVDMLYVEGDADRQEARHLMQALLAGAAKVRDFRVGDIKSHRLVDSGLSVLGPNCPLKHHLWCIHLTQLELDEADMQGIAAAWGPGLQALMLTSCSLTPEAWRAITPAAFPALSSMRLAMHFTMDLAVSVAAFCLEWPESHALSIIFARLPGHAVLAAGDTIALWRGLLRARGRCNPQLILGSQA